MREPYPVEQAQVARALEEILDAAQRKDFARLDSLHLDGPKFSKFDDGAYRGRQDAETSRKAERAGLGAIREFSPRVEDLKVDVFGPVAVATFLFPYEFVTAAGATSVRSRSTIVFVKDEGRWKIAHEHHSSAEAKP